MIQGFRQFILRGNVVDLAVGVVIGAAFGVVVNSLVADVFNPIIGAVFNTKSLATLSFRIPLSAGTATVVYGAFIAALVQFALTALVIYVAVVFPLNRVNQRMAARLQANQPAEEAPAAPTQTELLAEIRDLLARPRP